MKYKDEYKVVVKAKDIVDTSDSSMGTRDNTRYAIYQALCVLPEVLQTKFITVYNHEFGKYFQEAMNKMHDEHEAHWTEQKAKQK